MTDASISRFGSDSPELRSEPRREYMAARHTAAAATLPWRSLIAVRGRDAAQFLNGMLTQDIVPMTPGEVRPACQVDRRGHLVADLIVRRTADGALLDVPAERSRSLLDLYEKHRIMESLTLEAVTDLGAVLLLGPNAQTVLQFLGETGWPTRDVADPAYRIWTTDPAELLARATEAAAEPIGTRTLERLRIEAGRPRWGHDMDESNLPHEVRLEDGVSTSKGCYLGQETLARLHFRGHVNRSLYGVRAPGWTPDPGAEVRVDGALAGRLTSVAGPADPGDGLGLVLLRIDQQGEGRGVEVDGRAAILESLPFAEGRRG